MKILQLNIWMGKLLDQVLELVEQERPDILCLQEVYSSGQTSVLAPDKMFSSLEFIQLAAGHDYNFMAPTFSINLQDTKLNFGNAIVSKYPLLDQTSLFVNGEFTDQPDVTAKVLNTRNLQLARLNLDGKDFIIANHHGYWQPDPIGNQTTIDCMAAAANQLKTNHLPMILAGDLNVTAASPAMRVFDGLLEDLTATHQVEDTLSQLGKVSGVACDHILVSHEVKVNEFRVLDELVSDHKALILDFDL
jgi:endonuclease/exonuclease/phosphatase family metal-dependent hydrolase